MHTVKFRHVGSWTVQSKPATDDYAAAWATAKAINDGHRPFMAWVETATAPAPSQHPYLGGH